MWPKEVFFENRSPFMQEAVPISSYTTCTRVTVWFHQCKLRSNDRYGSNFIRIAPKHNEVQKMGQLVGSPILEHVHWVYQLVKGCINYIKSSNIRRTESQQLECFSSRLAVVFTQSFEVKNKDTVGAAPPGDASITSEWSEVYCQLSCDLYQRVWR